MLACCPAHTQKGLHFSAYRNWFSQLWTGLGSHSGSLWSSPAPQLLLPYLQLQWQSSSCVSSLTHFQQSHTNLFTKARPQAGTLFQIQLKRFLPSDVPSTFQDRSQFGIIWDSSKLHQTNSKHLLTVLSLFQTCEWTQYPTIKGERWGWNNLSFQVQRSFFMPETKVAVFKGNYEGKPQHLEFSPSQDGPNMCDLITVFRLKQNKAQSHEETSWHCKELSFSVMLSSCWWQPLVQLELARLPSPTLILLFTLSIC